MTKNAAPASRLGVAKRPTMHETASTKEKCPATGINSLRLRNAGLTPQNLPLWLKVSHDFILKNTRRRYHKGQSSQLTKGGPTVNSGTPPSQFAERELREKFSISHFLQNELIENHLFSPAGKLLVYFLN